MIRLLEVRFGFALLGSLLLLATMTSAQQKSAPQRDVSYDVSREVSVQGSVVSYSQGSSVVPFGPRLSLQTSSGVLDVHLGNARLLASSHLALATGDTVRIVGENVPFGSSTQFVARLIQKGNQVVLLRSTRGFPLRPMAAGGQSKAGVL